MILSNAVWRCRPTIERLVVTFNHGVEGSSPSALTKKIRHNLDFTGPAEALVWAACGQMSCRVAQKSAGQGWVAPGPVAWGAWSGNPQTCGMSFASLAAGRQSTGTRF